MIDDTLSRAQPYPEADRIGQLMQAATETLDGQTVPITRDFADGLAAWDAATEARDATRQEGWPSEFINDADDLARRGRERADAALDRAESSPEARALIVAGAQMVADKARREDQARRYAAQVTRSHAAFVGVVPVPPSER